MLRTIFSAGSWVCSCRRAADWAQAVGEPETGGSELVTLCIKKGPGTFSSGRKTLRDPQKEGRSPWPWLQTFERSVRTADSRQWGYKTSGFPFLLGDTQLDLLFVPTQFNYFKEPDLWDCYGKPVVELVGKPCSDHVHVGCAGSHEGCPSAHWSLLGMRLSPSSSGSGMTATVVLGWTDTQDRHLYWVYIRKRFAGSDVLLQVAQILMGKGPWKFLALQEREMFGLLNYF